MADTYTTNLNLTKPEPGAAEDTWGISLNADLDALDAIFSTSGTQINLNPNQINFADGKKAVFNSNLNIFSTGTSSYIEEVGTGDLYLKASNLYITDRENNQFISMIDNGTGGTLSLKHLGSTVLTTTSSGIDVTGTIVGDGLTTNGASEGDTYFTGGTANSRLLNIFTSTAEGSANAGHNFKIASGQGQFIFGNNTTANLLTVKSGGIDVTGTVNVNTIASTGDLTLDAVTNINLDADGGFIVLKDGGVAFGALGLSGGNFLIKPDGVDQDIVFNGNDGGSAITALTLDMSEGGNATFNGTITSGAITSTGNSQMANLVVTGDLTVQGTTTSVNTDDLNVKDKNITLNYSTGDSSASANGAGITIQDAVSSTEDATLTWNTANDSFNFSHDLNFADNVKAQFGSSALQIYSNGTNSYIAEGGTGDLLITTNGTGIRLQKNNGENMIKALTDGAVQLYYDNQDKLKTTSTGIDVTGTTTSDGLTVQTAQGDIKITNSASQIDMQRAGTNYIYASNASGSLRLGSGGSLSRLNIANNGDIAFYDDTGTSQNLKWDASADSLNFVDNAKAQFGAGNDIQIYHNGITSNGNIENYTGGLYITNYADDQDIIFRSDDGSGNVATYFQLDGSQAQLKVHKNMVFFDNVKASFGDSADLQIYHNGSNSYIDDAGQGALNIRSNGLFLEKYTGEVMITAIADGAVTLYNDNSAKLATTSSGINVTGEISGVTAIRHANSNAQVIDNDNDTYFIINDPEGMNRILIGDSGDRTTMFRNDTFRFQNASGTERARINSSGQLLIGKTASDNTTVGTRIDGSGFISSVVDGDNALLLNRLNSDGGIVLFRKDGSTVGSIGANSGYLVIGSSNNNADAYLLMGNNLIHPASSSGSGRDATIDLGASSNRFKNLYLSGTAYAQYFGSSADTNTLIQFAGSDDIRFRAGGTEQMRIKTTGVGIGTSSLIAKLHVKGAGNTSSTNAIFADNSSSAGIFAIRDNGDAFILGNTGIGEVSPDGKLHIKGGTATGDASHVLFENTQGSKVFAIGGGASGVTNNNLFFRNVTDNTTPMVITDAGSVGIGTALPTAHSGTGFVVHATTGGSGNTGSPRIRLTNTTTGQSATDGAELSLDGNTKDFYIENREGQDIIFYSGSERARFDSSGLFLVGKTSGDFGTQGSNLVGGGHFVKDGNTALYLNRLSSDGSILAFYKDSSLKGSIGVLGDRIYFAGANEAVAIDDSWNAFIPVGTGGGNSSGDTDLGNPSSKFKDLYLSGTISSGAITSSGQLTSNGGGVNVNGGTGNAYVSIGSDTGNWIWKNYRASHHLALEDSDGTGEVLRVDTSGNLLVGTTDSSLYNNTTGVGVAIHDNHIQVARSSGVPLYLNRQTSDGTIAEFRKNGSTVGSIGVGSSNKMTIIGTNANLQLGASNAALLNLDTNKFYPQTDNSVDLGFSSSANRFRDLYLSGTINVGDGHTIGNDASDNLLIAGSSGENIIIDSADDIILDSDGGDVIFKDGGVEQARLKLGKFGLGVSSPVAKLDVLNSSANAPVATFTGNYTANGDVALSEWQRSGGAVKANFAYVDSTTDMEFGTTTSHGLGIKTGNTRRLTITSAGDANFTGAISAEDNIYLTDAGTTRGRIELNASDRDDLDIVAVSLSSNLKFFTQNTEVGRFDASGRLGIKNSNPTATLTVGTLSSGQTGNVVINNEGGNTATLEVLSRTNRSILKVADNDTTGYISAENGLFSIGRNSGNNSANININTSNLVGIGTNNPSDKLSLNGAVNASTGLTIGNNNSTRVRLYHSDAGGYSALTTDGMGTEQPLIIGSGQYLAFYANGSERARFDTSGRLIVGGTTAGETGATTIYPNGNITSSSITATGDGTFNFSKTETYNPVIVANDVDSDTGQIIALQIGGTTKGSIGISSATGNDIYIASGTTSSTGFGLRFLDYTVTNAVLPCRGDGSTVDDTVDLGNSGARFDDIYATNGTINTSDRNDKQDIQALTEAEQRVATACKGLIRRFRWQSAVTQKGDDARYHFGIIAQDLQDAFEAEGLDAGDYGMFISSTWTDDEGNEQTRLGVRYNELLAFIITTL